MPLMKTANTVLDDRRAAPRYPTTVQMLTLSKACELAGGVSKLAVYLHVPAPSVVRWLHGDERPPSRVFLDCVDLVLLHERHLVPVTS